MCTCVSEEGGDGEGAVSGALSLLSYTLRLLEPLDEKKKFTFGSEILEMYFLISRTNSFAKLLPNHIASSAFLLLHISLRAMQFPMPVYLL
jgi:hypothetical protein